MKKTEYRLKCYELSKDKYESRTYNRLKNWDRYIVSNRALDREINYIKNDTYSGKRCHKSDGRMLLLMGSAKMPRNIKGNHLSPHNPLIKKAKNRIDIDLILVDEFRTTMLCSICSTPLVTSKSPHRYQYCTHCKITFNRDITGGRNIL